jgi:hypothetical protein
LLKIYYFLKIISHHIKEKAEFIFLNELMIERVAVPQPFLLQSYLDPNQLE